MPQNALVHVHPVPNRRFQCRNIFNEMWKTSFWSPIGRAMAEGLFSSCGCHFSGILQRKLCSFLNYNICSKTEKLYIAIVWAAQNILLFSFNWFLCPHKYAQFDVLSIFWQCFTGLILFTLNRTQKQILDLIFFYSVH